MSHRRILWMMIGISPAVLLIAGGSSFAGSMDKVVLPAVEMPSDSNDSPLVNMPSPPSSLSALPSSDAVDLPPITLPAADHTPVAQPQPFEPSVPLPAAAVAPVAVPEPEPTATAPQLPAIEMPVIPMDQAATIPASEPVPASTEVMAPTETPQPAASPFPPVLADTKPISDPSIQPAAVIAPNASASPEPQAPDEVFASLPPVNNAMLSSAPGLSIGNFGQSLMYSDEDINNLQQVLEVFEAVKSQSVAKEGDKGTQEADLLAELLRASKGDVEAAPVVLTAMPSFYVGTIIVQSGGDWSTWINGTMFNRARSENATMGVRIVGVTREMVTLAWKPENVAQAYQRYQDVQAEAKTKSAPAKKPSDDKNKEGQSQTNKTEVTGVEALVAAQSAPYSRQKAHREVPMASVEFDKEAGEFIVTLRPNQTFVANSMQIMEGRFSEGIGAAGASTAPVAGSSAAADGAATSSATSAMPATGDAPAMGTDERALANQLIGNLQKMGNMIPGVGGAAAPAMPNIPSTPALPSLPTQ